jgi:hypothetical protein
LDPLVCSNIYSDLFSDNTNKTMTETALENSVSWSKDNIIVKNQINPYYTLVKNINPNAKLWITEIGWTSAPLASFATGKGWASVDVEKKMYENFLNASTDQGIVWPERVFWFTIRDTRNAVKNESFGLFDENFDSKFGDSPSPPPPTKNSKFRSVFYPNTSSDYMTSLPSNEEVYVYTDNYFKVGGDNLHLDKTQQYLKSIGITDQLATPEQLTDAVQKGFFIYQEYNIVGVANDGYCYAFDMETPQSGYFFYKYPDCIYRNAVFLYGVKKSIPPYNCQNVAYNKLGACIYPFAYRNKYSMWSRGDPRKPIEEVYYTEKQDGFLYDFASAKSAASKMQATIATKEQIKAQFDNGIFYYPYKNGWASDGNLYKTDAKTLTLSINQKIGGIFLYGLKPPEGSVDPNTDLIPFPYSYQYIWSISNS